jgi:hypothetical protein
MYLLIEPPIYKTELITIRELIGERKGGLGENYITIQLKDAAVKFFEKSITTPIERDDYGISERAIVICAIEEPAKYQIFTYEKNDTSILDMSIVYRKLVSNGRIVESSKDRRNVNLPVIKVPKPSFEWRELIGAIKCGGMKGTIIEIQKQLNKKGYKCPENGVLNKETKAAIIRFQRDNNLPEGRLDIETLEKLGVQ